jgi:hypothetical protein
MSLNFRNLDLDSLALKSTLSGFTLNVNDYEMVTPTLARVMLTYTGNVPQSHEEIRAEVARMLKGLASPVAESFRKVKDGVVAGYVKTAREVREFDQSAVTAGMMKEMAANLLMDKTDESLWEKKSGASGEYLVRQGNDDLSGLVHLATNKQLGQPTFAHLASMPAESKEFAAYVSKETEEVEHGYVVASASGKMSVIPFGADETVEVQTAQLVEVINLDGEDAKAAGGMMAAEVAADKNAMVEYYRKMFSYAPDYVQKIIDIITQHSFA